VPVSKKALIASHVNDVKTRICKGFHVEVTARQEQDVEPSVIMKKVRDSSGAKYSHQQKDLLHVKKDLVPGRDDSLTSQGHETVVDGAQRIRAEREARERELVAREKASQQQQIKPVEQVARPEPKSIVSSSVVSSSSVSAAKPVETGNTKSVRNMWADREKKGSAENLSSPLGSRDNLSKAAPLPPRPQPSQPSQASQLHQQQQKAEEEHRQREEKEREREEMERERAAEEQRLKLQKKAEEEEKEEEERQRILAAAAEEELMKQKQQAAVEVRVSSPGLTARALYDYNATEQNEISFREGSTIYQVVQVDDGNASCLALGLGTVSIY
jgi:drebrin-like protein